MPIFSETQLTATERNAGCTPSFLEVLGGSIKALVPKAKRVIPFSLLGRNNYPTLGGDYGFYGGGSPGSTYDYRAAAGELLENSVVAACVDSVGQALADAPPILEKLVGTEWESVPGHPLLDLLNYPNKYHNPFEIWSAVAGAEMTTGEAFWRLEWNAARTRPTEIWYERPDSMRVIGTDDEYIAKYIFRRDDGAQFELDNSDVVHFRYALNPWNARRGTAPIQAGLRQIAGDNGAATFHGALLRNCAVMSLLVSVKDGQNDNTTPDQLDEFTRLLSQKLRGDNAGAIAGVNLPLDVHKMGYSPDEMALDKLISYYETRICALLRVDPMVVSLGSGTMQKTYANMGEALNDFWERRILPTKKRHSAVLGAQLLPLFGLDPSTYRISWDYRNVAPLQENEDARHARYREDYRAGVIDLYDAQIGLGMNPDQSMRGVFYGDNPGSDETKSLKIRDRNGRWHGEHNGRFESMDGAGGGGAPRRGQGAAGASGSSGGGIVGGSSGQGSEGVAGESSRGRAKGSSAQGAGGGGGSGNDSHSGSSSGGTGGSGSGPDTSSTIESSSHDFEDGDFERMHTWYGDKVPKENSIFQAGKAAVMSALVPFTDEAMGHEAGVAILEENGTLVWGPDSNEDGITIGGPYSVKIPRPKKGYYATLHTHPDYTSFSGTDYYAFFRNSREIQMHVLTEEYTFSLYKPEGWQAPDSNTKEGLKAEVAQVGAEASAEALDKGIFKNLGAIEAAKLSRIARQYGLSFRIGKRKPTQV